MADNGSVAPKERVNIVYKAATGDAQEQKELPLKLFVMGDFTGRADSTPLENRKAVNVDKDNFNDVLAAHKVELTANVKNALSDEKDAELPVSLKFKTMRDFEPEQVAKQVPELKKLIELREALSALKGPLGNVPAFRKKIQSLVDDEKTRAAILDEIKPKE
ncbi:MAG: type VI secretion system contractile sheath small subunit [Planctomycetes bacterium]|nr:type VI secretion system contractile sheath small subunit [Planctomycetota bacterium]